MWVLRVLKGKGGILDLDSGALVDSEAVGNLNWKKSCIGAASEGTQLKWCFWLNAQLIYALMGCFSCI